MIIGFSLGWALIFTISYAYKLIRKEHGFGSGDKWLLGSLGLWTGYYDITLIFFQSCIFATIYILIFKNNLTKKIPIGSFFCVTSIPYLFLI
jgi:prepilin signal peptidase PulO-like enzyme (type II secretory pathway)